MTSSCLAFRRCTRKCFLQVATLSNVSACMFITRQKTGTTRTLWRNLRWSTRMTTNLQTIAHESLNPCNENRLHERIYTLFKCSDKIYFILRYRICAQRQHKLRYRHERGVSVINEIYYVYEYGYVFNSLMVWHIKWRYWSLRVPLATWHA